MKNKIILDQLLQKERELEHIVCESLKLTTNKTQDYFYQLWKNHDKNDAIEVMLLDLKQNITEYWLNKKYANDLTTTFNLLYLEHGGLYGGEYDAYSIDFQNPSSELPKFEIMDNRFLYLENISGLPAFEIPLLDLLTCEIQGKEDDFDDWDDVMNLYNLFENTAYIETHQTLLRAHQENLFCSIPIKNPFYIAVGEHDGGAPQLVYIVD